MTTILLEFNVIIHKIVIQLGFKRCYVCTVSVSLVKNLIQTSSTVILLSTKSFRRVVDYSRPTPPVEQEVPSTENGSRTLVS